MAAMELSNTFVISCVLMVIAFGFGALLGFNMIATSGRRRRHGKLYEYKYKPVTLSLSENEVRARVRELVEEKEAASVRAMMKGRSAKPVQRVTATMAPSSAEPAPEVVAKPVAAPAPQPTVVAPVPEAKPEPKSAEIISLGQRRPGLVFYRVDNKPEHAPDSAAANVRPPVSGLAALSPDAVVILVRQVGSGHEPFRLEGPDGEADELSLISGITEALERALNRLGIYHFWQIAAWSSEHVAWVSARVPGGERIARENWIAQAARLIDMPKRVFNIDED